MNLSQAMFVGGALLCVGAHAADPCGSTLPGDKRVLENARYRVAYRTDPQIVPAGTDLRV